MATSVVFPSGLTSANTSTIHVVRRESWIESSLKMRKLIGMLRTGPVIVGEFRGGKSEIAKRFDKSDKNAAPIEFGMFKFTLELLADGAPVIVSVFLDRGVNAEQFASTVQLKRGDIVATAVN